MIMPWLILLLEIVLAIPLRFIGISFSAEIVVMANVLAVEVFILRQKKEVMRPLFVAYILRLLAMVYDLSTLNLSNMNGDTLGYYNTAVQWMNGQAPANVYGLYSRLLGYLFRITGPSRPLVEYLNVLMGLSVIWIFYKCMCMCNISNRVKIISIWIIAIFPYSIYSSCVTYRETIVATLVSLSVYYALKWYLNQKWSNIIFSVVFVAFAAAFHAGVIVMIIGYVLLFTMYSYKNDRFTVNKKTMGSLGLFAVAFVIIVVVFPEIFLAKLYGMSEESIVAQVNYNYGGSAYLSWLHPNSITQVVLASPLKLIYFLFSPLPDNWRGIVDIATFVIDSCVYIYCIYYILNSFRKAKYRHFIFAVFIGWIATALVFGLGTWTAGTAIRHRNKIFMVLLLLAAMSSVKKDEERAKE